MSEGVNITETDDETRSLTWQELGYVSNAGSTQNTPVLSEEVARQFKAVTDPLTKQLELHCDEIKELRQAPIRRCK